MKRKHLNGCQCCASGSATLVFYDYGCPIYGTSMSYPLPGSTISVTQGGTTLTGTTNSSGYVAFSVPSAGTWSYTSTPSSARLGAVSGTVTVAGGATVTTSITTHAVTSGYVCAGCGPFPLVAGNLFGSWPGGALTFTYYAPLSGSNPNPYPIWTTGFVTPTPITLVDGYSFPACSSSAVTNYTAGFGFNSDGRCTLAAFFARACGIPGTATIFSGGSFVFPATSIAGTTSPTSLVASWQYTAPFGFYDVFAGTVTIHE